jgi:hypothetical protein
MDHAIAAAMNAAAAARRVLHVRPQRYAERP